MVRHLFGILSDMHRPALIVCTLSLISLQVYRRRPCYARGMAQRVRSSSTLLGCTTSTSHGTTPTTSAHLTTQQWSELHLQAQSQVVCIAIVRTGVILSSQAALVVCACSHSIACLLFTDIAYRRPSLRACSQ